MGQRTKAQRLLDSSKKGNRGCGETCNLLLNGGQLLLGKVASLGELIEIENGLGSVDARELAVYIR